MSPEEIEAAAREADLRGDGEGRPDVRGVVEERDDRHLINVEKGKEEVVVNEWLPESITKPSKRRKGRK